MIDVRFRPFPDPKPRPRRRSAFRATYSDTLNLLEYELHHLGAREIVIEAGYRVEQIRNDGWPRSGVRPAHPAVRLSFFARRINSPVAYPCDTFDHVEDNLRAVALSLQALRAVDRYGVTTAAEQYKGWMALPAPSASVTRDSAANFLSMHSGMTVAEICVSEVRRDEAYRKAARKLHPDVAGGSHSAFVELQDAMTVLTTAQR